MRIVTLAVGCVFQCAVSLAQPNSTSVDLKMLLGGGPGAVPQTIGEKAQAASDALAASSDAELSEARSHYLRYQTQSKNERDAQVRAMISRRRQSDLALQRDRALDEMRRGEFCSGCGQTRSEILAKGEQFPHPGQHIIVASPQQLEAKKREFDEKINKEKAEEYHALQDAQAAVQAKTDAAQQVINSYPLWRQALLSEDVGRAKAWDEAVSSYKEEFDSYQKKLQSLDAAIARARASELQPQAIRELLGEKEDCQANLRMMVYRAEREHFQRRMQEALFEQRIASGRKQLEGFISEVGGPPLDVLTSLTSLPNIQTACLTCPNGTSDKLRVPGTPFSITTAGGAPGLTASLGVFKASLRISRKTGYATHSRWIWS